MCDKSGLIEDLTILQDMYPELQLDIDLEDVHEERSTTVNGTLPFKISLSKDLEVKYENQCLKLAELSNDLLLFSVNSLTYPDLRNCISLKIQSKWMLDQDKAKVINGIHAEFDDLTCPSSELYDPFTPALMLLFGYLTDDIADILFSNSERFCQSQSEFDNYADINVSIAQEKMSRTNYNCTICLETKKGHKMIKLLCNHFLCINCTRSYFTSLIEEGAISKVRCPECKYTELDLNNFQSYPEMKKALFKPAITFSFFSGILSDETCERYEQLFHAQAAIKLSKHCISACVTCRRCDVWCVKEDLNDPMVQCKRCDFTFCFDCLHSWHGYNNKCGKKVTIPKDVIEEYIDVMENSSLDERRRALEVKYGKKILEVEVSDYLADQMLDLAIEEEGSNLQRCPQCRLVVQRSEGCNKMKCAICGTLFCYICGSLLHADDPYEHYREPYSDCYGLLFEGMPGADS